MVNFLYHVQMQCKNLSPKDSLKQNQLELQCAVCSTCVRVNLSPKDSLKHVLYPRVIVFSVLSVKHVFDLSSVTL